MPISSLEDIKQNLIPPVYILDENSVGSDGFIGFGGGQPTITSPASGQVITSSFNTWPDNLLWKYFSYKNPEAGKSTYICGASSLHTKGSTIYPNSQGGSIILIDILWMSIAVSILTTSLQTINSTTLPPRDINGTTNGDGVYAFIYNPLGITSSSIGNITITYTNSAGVSDRVGIVDFSETIACAANIFTLQSEDLGIKSIQSIQLASSTTNAGNPNTNLVLCLFRPLTITGASFNMKTLHGPDTLLLTKIYDNTTLAPLVARNSSSFSIASTVQLTQG